MSKLKTFEQKADTDGLDIVGHRPQIHCLTRKDASILGNRYVIILKKSQWKEGIHSISSGFVISDILRCWFKHMFLRFPDVSEESIPGRKQPEKDLF